MTITSSFPLHRHSSTSAKKLPLLALLLGAAPLPAQTTPPKTNDTTTPLPLLKPDYPIPYGQVKAAEVKQVTQFAPRMFNKSKGLYMHGWVQEMSVHPEFHWARANGWALLTKVELLDVLPADHPSRRCWSCCAPTPAASPPSRPAAASGTSYSTATILRWSRNGGQQKDVYFFCDGNQNQRVVARQTA